jgi:hypothetical protein
MAFLSGLTDEILDMVVNGGILGLNDLGSAVGGIGPGAMMSGNTEDAAASLMGGGIAGGLMRQLPLKDIVNAAGSVARQGGAAGAAMGAIPGVRSLPAAAAAGLAGGAAGGVMDEQDKLRRMLMSIYR